MKTIIYFFTYVILMNFGLFIYKDFYKENQMLHNIIISSLSQIIILIGCYFFLKIFK